MAIKEGRTSQLSYKGKHVKMFIYGKSRTGKTWFASTMLDPYFVCTEEGLNGLGDAGLDFPYCLVETYQDLLDIIEDIKLGKRAEKCKSLILDDLGGITDIIMKVYIGERRRRNMKREEWPAAVGQLRSAIANFNDCVKTHHILLLARSVLLADRNDDGVESYFGVPDTIGKFAHAVGGLYDFCFYSVFRENFSNDLKMKIPQPVLCTTTTGKYSCGARVAPGRFPPEFPNDWDTFYKYLTAPPKLTPRPAPKDTTTKLEIKA